MNILLDPQLKLELYPIDTEDHPFLYQLMNEVYRYAYRTEVP